MEILKKLLVAGLVVALMGLAWTRARHALAGPEDLIRWRLEGMVDGFHSNTLRHVMAGFHQDYRDSATGHGREHAADALRYLFFQEHDSVTGKFAYRLEIPEDELVISLDPEDEERADVTLRAVFYRTQKGLEEVWWDMRASLTFVRDEGDWRIVTSKDVNHRDRKGRR
jgi:hypothetical protein